MVVGANLHGREFVDVLEAAFEGSDELLLADPMADAVEALTSVLTAVDDPPTVRLLAAPALLKTVMDDFVVASTAADHVAAGTLAVRTGDADDANALLLTDETVWALVAAGGRVAALGSDDDRFVDAAGETYDDRWAASSSFDLRTPPLSAVRRTLGDEIGEGTRADFDAALDALVATRESAGAFDEVMLALLVSAHNDVLLYDISKWGEDVGVASKATFSRTKTMLEEAGLIRTEKVPIDVGRPRLRLKLAEERFDEVTPATLAETTLDRSD
jgi:DNA-binding transcriptional ArsR family regulator